MWIAPAGKQALKASRHRPQTITLWVDDDDGCNRVELPSWGNRLVSSYRNACNVAHESTSLIHLSGVQQMLELHRRLNAPFYYVTFPFVFFESLRPTEMNPPKTTRMNRVAFVDQSARACWAGVIQSGLVWSELDRVMVLSELNQTWSGLNNGVVGFWRVLLRHRWATDVESWLACVDINQMWTYYVVYILKITRAAHFKMRAHHASNEWMFANACNQKLSAKFKRSFVQGMITNVYFAIG